MSGIIVDIGTGDGKFAYELARENPDKLIIGIDPSHDSLEKVSHKATRKPAKGGLKNAAYVLSRVEELPEELTGVANQVFINFPWSGLLKGVVLVEDETWDNVQRICQPGAIVDLIFGYDEGFEKNKTQDLPELSLEYVKKTMIPKLEARGFKAEEVREVGVGDLEGFPSSWAKKLRFGKDRGYYYVRLKNDI